MNKQWNILNTKLNRNDIREIRARFSVTSAMATIMLNRAVTADKAEEFLNRTVKLYDPFLLRDMDKACERIKAAIDKGEKITVYGDYDVDGITSVAIVVRYLKSVGANCDFYIPSREEEGYGVNRDALSEIAKGQSSVVITVDTGITAIDETEYARELGIDMVITDHHTVKEEIPAAWAVINPKRRDCGYPFKELSGAGVAFKLICALDGRDDVMFEEYSDLVALSAIADVVPLVGENRAMVYHGIEKIKNNPKPGILALIDEAKIDRKTISSRNIAFGIAPRINAAGRIDKPHRATELLLTDEEQTAQSLSKSLNETNEIRKRIGNEIYREADKEILGNSLDKKRVIVIKRDDWHQGVIGIIASKLSEKYNRTVILISSTGEFLKGSGRSVKGFNLFEALDYCRDLLIKFGGHERAAGLSLSEDNLEEFVRQINIYADNVMKNEDAPHEILIDMPLELNGSLLRLLDDMDKLEPYGIGNEQPVFAVFNGQIQSIRYSRDGAHLFLKILKNGKIINAVGFGMGHLGESELKIGSIVSIAANLYRNEYNGNVYPQFQIIDIRW